MHNINWVRSQDVRTAVFLSQLQKKRKKEKNKYINHKIHYTNN